MDFLDATGAARLNLVSTAVDLKLGGNYVTSTTDINATMSQSAGSITITLGSIVSGTVATAAAATMTWVPAAAAKDTTNHASSTALVAESGGADVDL